MKRFYALEALVFLSLVLATTRCHPQTSAQAEAAYTAEQLACVDAAKTRAESRACRARVDQKWKVRP